MLLLTNASGNSLTGSGAPLTLRVAHQIQLGQAAPCERVGLCLSFGHLLVGTREFSVWGCTFTLFHAGAMGAHFLHCAGEPEVSSSVESVGDVVCMNLDDSSRFLATLHKVSGGTALRVWSQLEGGPEPCEATVRPRRRPTLLEARGFRAKANVTLYCSIL